MNDPRPWMSLHPTQAIARLIAYVEKLRSSVADLESKWSPEAYSELQGELRRWIESFNDERRVHDRTRMRIYEIEQFWPEVIALVKKNERMTRYDLESGEAVRVPIAHSGDRVASDGRVLVDGEYVAKLERIRDAAKRAHSKLHHEDCPQSECAACVLRVAIFS